MRPSEAWDCRVFPTKATYYLAALVAFQNELADVKWQLSGSGKAQVNASMKSISIGIGDKMVSLDALGKELLKGSQEQQL